MASQRAGGKASRAKARTLPFLALGLIVPWPRRWDGGPELAAFGWAGTPKPKVGVVRPLRLRAITHLFNRRWMLRGEASALSAWCRLLCRGGLLSCSI